LEPGRRQPLAVQIVACPGKPHRVVVTGDDLARRALIGDLPLIGP
jgi:hypothetical protein